MSGMTTGPQWPEMPGEPAPTDSRRAAWPAAAWCAGLLAGCAALGLLGGWIWNEVAPRVLLQEVSAGTAEVVSAETRAFFGADVWFCLIALVAGLLTGVAGYRVAVAPRTGYARAAVTAALILGALAGGVVMMWLGGQIGLSAYNSQLAGSANGALFNSSLALGAKSALALWPLFTAVVLLVAEWGNRPGLAAAPGAGPVSAGPVSASPVPSGPVPSGSGPDGQPAV